MQLLLFDDLINKETANKRLQRYVSRGLQFLTISEVSIILDLTLSQIRNAIYLYRLDALLISGVYRIPFFSVEEYIKDKNAITRQFFSYKKYIEEHEIDGILEYHSLIAYGLEKENAIKILKAKNEYITDEIIQDIDKYIPEEKTEAVAEVNIIDWYDLKRLELPYKVSLSNLSNLLRIPLKSILDDLEVDKKCCSIDWPEVYDLLVSKEIVNLPVEYRAKRNYLNENINNDDNYRQMELF